MTTEQYYVSHYFNFANSGKFLLVAFAGLAAVMAIILGVARVRQKQFEQEEAREKKLIDRPYVMIESFYELVFSSTSILIFLSLYYILDAYISRYYVQAAVAWQNYRDVVLLLFIIFSVFVTNWFDIVLVRLTHIKSSQKASVRLVSTIYIIFILLYIRFIYEDTNYNGLILYFVTLAIGRFIYFDFTLKEFEKMIAGVAKNLPLLLLLVLYSGFVCWYGFRVDFLLTSNGVIVSTLIAHLFMDFSIFVLHKTRLMKLFL